MSNMADRKSLLKKKGELGERVKRLSPELRKAGEGLSKLEGKKAQDLEGIPSRTSSYLRIELERLKKDLNAIENKASDIEKLRKLAEKSSNELSELSSKFPVMQDSLSSLKSSSVSQDRFDREFSLLKRSFERLQKEQEKAEHHSGRSLSSMESSIKVLKESLAGLEGILKDELASELAEMDEKTDSWITASKEKLDQLAELKSETESNKNTLLGLDSFVRELEKKRSDDAQKTEKLILTLVSETAQKEAEKNSKKLYNDLRADLNSVLDQSVKTLEKTLDNVKEKLSTTLGDFQKEAERQRSEMLKQSKQAIDEMGRKSRDDIVSMFRLEEERALKTLEGEASERTNKAIRAKMDFLREEILNELRVAATKEEDLRVSEMAKLAKKEIEGEIENVGQKMKNEILKDLHEQRAREAEELLTELFKVSEREMEKRLDLFKAETKNALLEQTTRMKDDLVSMAKREIRDDMEDMKSSLKSSFDKEATSALKNFELDFQSRMADKIDSIVEKKLKSETSIIKDIVLDNLKPASLEVIQGGLQRNMEMARELIEEETKRMETEIRDDMEDMKSSLKSSFDKEATSALKNFELDFQSRMADKIDSIVEKKLKSETSIIKDIVLDNLKPASLEVIQGGLQRNMEMARELIEEETKRMETEIRTSLSERLSEAASLKFLQMEKDIDKGTNQRLSDMERKMIDSFVKQRELLDKVRAGVEASQKALQARVKEALEEGVAEVAGNEKAFEARIAQTFEARLAKAESELGTLNDRIIKAVTETFSEEFASMKSEVLTNAKIEVMDQVKKVEGAMREDMVDAMMGEIKNSMKDTVDIRTELAEIANKMDNIGSRASKDAADMASRKLSEMEKSMNEMLSRNISDFDSKAEGMMASMINATLPKMEAGMRSTVKAELLLEMDEELRRQFTMLNSDNRTRLEEIERQIENAIKKGTYRYGEEMREIESRIREETSSIRKEGMSVRDTLEDRVTQARKEFSEILEYRLKEIYIEMARKIEGKMSSQEREKDRLKDILDELDDK